MEIDKSENLFDFFKKAPEPAIVQVENTPFKEKLSNILAIIGFIGMFSLIIFGMYFVISSGNKAEEEEKNITLNAINTISNVVSDKNLNSNFQKTSIDYIDNKKLTFRAKKVDNTITVVLGDVLRYQRNIISLTQKIKDKNMKVVEIVQVFNPETLNEEIKLTIEN